jgi:hypothetical protein
VVRLQASRLLRSLWFHQLRILFIDIRVIMWQESFALHRGPGRHPLQCLQNLHW